MTRSCWTTPVHSTSRWAAARPSKQKLRYCPLFDVSLENGKILGSPVVNVTCTVPRRTHAQEHEQTPRRSAVFACGLKSRELGLFRTSVFFWNGIPVLKCPAHSRVPTTHELHVNPQRVCHRRGQMRSTQFQNAASVPEHRLQCAAAHRGRQLAAMVHQRERQITDDASFHGDGQR